MKSLLQLEWWYFYKTENLFWGQSMCDKTEGFTLPPVKEVNLLFPGSTGANVRIDRPNHASLSPICIPFIPKFLDEKLSIIPCYIE